MKSLNIIFIALMLNAASCEKNTDISSAKSLEGTWIFKKQLIDPGNGSGRYTDVAGSPYITFNPGGSAASNYMSFGLGMVNSYQVIDSVKVLFSFKEQSSQPNITYRYKFSGDTLILNPPCFEACGFKLVR